MTILIKSSNRDEWKLLVIDGAPTCPQQPKQTRGKPRFRVDLANAREPTGQNASRPESSIRKLGDFVRICAHRQSIGSAQQLSAAFFDEAGFAIVIWSPYTRQLFDS
ncbi:hypothetical protein AS156_06165 [Bradyrhizobium macuxiense]|uniref:Uncharacterized protein n=1 Tax=Bradyrhizobium macuxiense TaxID=1755647 RepID=A0A109JUM6_9BRAD|nr:hypothetical protein [Bradyrhizobium macuxiense]KWV55245.1 hypothetical protein AS156_06165 [Bradyrhizobium macuxiense]